MAAAKVTCWVDRKVYQRAIYLACLKETRKEFDFVALMVSCLDV
jgi:hypothetical protein